MAVGSKRGSSGVKLFWHVLVGVALLAVLSACVTPAGYGYLAQEKVYRLAPQLGALQRRSLAHLFIPVAQVSPAIDSQRIVLFKPAYQQDFLANGRWPDRLSTYFTSTVIDALSRSNAFLTVSDRPTSNQGGYKLLLRLTGFHAEYLPKSQAKVAVVAQMEALLIREKNQRILGQYRYDIRKDNINAHPDSIVVALNQALADNLTSLANDMGKDLPVLF
ncbi:protein of unknown function DUF330 [Thiothrix nivea DSM 5205]|uniref:ABC-type transport auxiliary lipoprotein component domain-containing protein n=1 Tax=Thiothrix nivea (strain ATCC 35100 / DSM 5205 / JP2) TaxID=870187 RepID=A0A656HJX3_THINJ|nr:protein of unknown function DUF330 [Thiothrix nivea DSM 5205]